MPYLVQYQLQYKDAIDGEIISVTINKASSFSPTGTPVITQLTGTGSAFVVLSIDNDRAKFNPFRAKSAEITFLSEPGILASTFSGPDSEWYVEAMVVSTGRFLFRGFLVAEDHEQAFLPVTTYSVKLTATDNLGTLKEVPLTDDSGNYMRGKKKIIEIIAQCLRKTGLKLDIIVNDTWFEENTTSFHPACDQVYLDMKTFEKAIGEAVDCYQALQIIFSNRLSITQTHEGWLISNIDERTGNALYRFRFDYQANFIEQMPTITLNQTIGRTEVMKFINVDAIVTFTRPYKFTKLTYKFEFPREIVDNIDFSRGTSLYIPLDMSPVVIDGVTYYVNKYHIDDWILKAGTINTPAAVTRTAYIKKLYYDTNKTYEASRYVVIENGSSSPMNWLESNPIPILKKDRFVISIDFSLSSDIGGRTLAYYGIVVLLIADDGTKYVYGSRPVVGDYKWKVYDDSVDMARQVYTALRTDDTNETERNSISGDVPPAPASGEVFILLPGYNGADIKYSNLQFEYTPYVNGDYSKYDGFSAKVSQTGDYKANIDEQVYINDSQIKLAKGAMFRKVGSSYVLTKGWFAGGDLLRQGLLTSYPPSSVYIHPFWFLQIYAIWNQYNRPMVILTGSVHRLQLGSDSVPDLANMFQVNAAVPEVQNKYFMPSGIEQDYNDGKWSVTLLEAYDTALGKDFSTPAAFKYESA